jgi:Ser/Thr protein kinase RdoA (MazF antagonist)
MTDVDAFARVRAAFPQLAGARIEPMRGGLINTSYQVFAGETRYVLQRVSHIFSPAIHGNIALVTERLRAHGIGTFSLERNGAGELSTDLGEDGRWRLLTRVPGVGFDVCESPGQARSAGALVARFHGALAELEQPLASTGRAVVHDPPHHFRNLQEALRAHADHRYYRDVAALAERVHSASMTWEPLDDLPKRICHGDLKFNNVLFEGEGPGARERAVALIDLDTVARMPLWHELGDAWRSWCNARGEDSREAELDVARLEAAVSGYLEGAAFALDARERRSLAHGVERISLELSARFAADALAERYFGWDPGHYATRGEHNLVRACGQLSLHDQLRATRDQRLRLLAG